MISHPGSLVLLYIVHAAAVPLSGVTQYLLFSRTTHNAAVSLSNLEVQKPPIFYIKHVTAAVKLQKTPI